MSGFRIGNETFERGEDDAAAQQALARAYSAKIRPLCVCRDPGVEMYIAKVDGKFIVKRMPNSGSDHRPACDSYEPPAELSGLGEVMGSAIQENTDDGETSLRLDFSLTKIGNRSSPAPSGAEADSVRTDGTKLTLRGTLHYLWDQAGFTRWSPRMAGKRGWKTIRYYLLAAAEGKTTKGSGLRDFLYIPEPYAEEKRTEINQRRVAQMSKIARTGRGARRLMLVVGDVHDIAQARYGHKIVFEHMPDCHFLMNEDLYKRFLKRFDVEIGLWNAIDGAHLVVIGTFGVDEAGIATLEEVAAMVVTSNWIPFEHMYDKMLLDALTAQERHFIKGLRYNLASGRPVACAVLSDTQPPCALYVIPPGVTENFTSQLQSLQTASKYASWEWTAGGSEVPALPARGAVPMAPRTPTAKPAPRPTAPALSSPASSVADAGASAAGAGGHERPPVAAAPAPATPAATPAPAPAAQPTNGTSASSPKAARPAVPASRTGQADASHDDLTNARFKGMFS